MKTVAQIQLVFTWISIVGFALPSGVVVFYAILAMGSTFNGRSLADLGENAQYLLGATAVLVGMVGTWWIGLRMLRGYNNILHGRVAPAKARTFWFGSLAFNLLGVLIIAVILVQTVDSSSDWRGWALYSLPSVLGTMLALVALCLPNESLSIPTRASHLE
jgi:hypothetical protein